MLTYMPRDHARHEYVTVTPDGFKFRRQNFETLSSLMKWFKEHFRDPIPGGNKQFTDSYLKVLAVIKVRNVRSR